MNYYATMKKNKSISVISIAILYAFLLVIYWLNGSPLSFGLYLAIGIWSYFNPLILLSLIGASNYLPAVLGLSPLLITTGIMLCILILQTKSIFAIPILDIDYRTILWFGMFVWSMLLSIVQKDTSFMSSILTMLICIVIVRPYINKYDKKCKSINYLMLGIGFFIVLTILIQLGVPGFESYHWFRLAIGERADPNSSGLLIAIFSVFSFIQLFDNLNAGLKKVIPYLICFSLGVWGLLLTQSRASILCMSLCVLAYLVFTNKKRLDRKGIFVFVALIVIVAVAVVIARLKGFSILGDALNGFIDRLNNNESADGDRIYLLKKSIEAFMKHPILGISIEQFRINVGHIPHNTLADYMVTSGIFGIIFFIIMFIVPIIRCYPSKSKKNAILPYYCYLVCIMNFMSYSASNEKIIIPLLIILIHSIKMGENRKIYNTEIKRNY